MKKINKLVLFQIIFANLQTFFCFFLKVGTELAIIIVSFMKRVYFGESKSGRVFINDIL